MGSVRLSYWKSIAIGSIPFFGIAAYALWPEGAPAKDPLVEKLIAEFGTLATEQRRIAAEFAVKSGSFIAHMTHCPARVPEGATGPGVAELELLLEQMQRMKSDMTEAGRALLLHAFEPFAGAGLDDNAMAAESLRLLNLHMKQSEIKPETCNTVELDRLNSEQRRLAIAISSNAYKAKTLKIRALLDAGGVE